MREKGARLTDKNANFGGFAVLRNPIIDPLYLLACLRACLHCVIRDVGAMVMQGGRRGMQRHSRTKASEASRKFGGSWGPLPEKPLQPRLYIGLKC